jgi:hypothetical protein
VQNAGAGHEIQPLLLKAEQQEKVRRAVTNEMAEARLDLATELWQARLRICSAPDSSGNDPLPVLMHKISE